MKRRRNTIRLKNYDYSNPGEYFVTICTQDRKFVFGEVQNGEVYLNQNGEIARSYLLNIPVRYPDTYIDSYIVMPDHIHMIISIIPNPLRGFHEIPLTGNKDTKTKRRRMLLPMVIGWYKMNVARDINQLTGNTGNKFWQRNYYEHIVRNEQDLDRIRYYIGDNPRAWSAAMNV